MTDAPPPDVCRGQTHALTDRPTSRLVHVGCRWTDEPPADDKAWPPTGLEHK